MGSQAASWLEVFRQEGQPLHAVKLCHVVEDFLLDGGGRVENFVHLFHARETAFAGFDRRKDVSDSR